MSIITSTSNSKIKHVRRLSSSRRYRNQQQAYVIEGSRWLAELAQSGIEPQLVLVTSKWLDLENNRLVAQSLQNPVIAVSDQVMAHASETESSSGVLAVVPMEPRPLPTKLTFLLILDRISDPGNLGTLLRTASASAVDGVILTPGCVDVYNPKVVRSSMGSHLKLPVHKANWDEVSAMTAGMDIWLAAATGDVDYSDVNWSEPSAVIIGSEPAGTGREAGLAATGRVMIPMQQDTESLNAAVAAGIILFEAYRQRATK